MKKTICFILCCTFLIASFGATSYASAEVEYPIMPRLNNTASTNTTFVIDSNGAATIKVSFIGFEGITTGATIKIKLQKQFLFFFWQDVDIGGDDDNILRYEVVGDNYNKSLSLSLSSGTYKLQVEYEIRGTAGSSDILAEEIELSC